jgi:hypothetical protein
MSAAHFVRPRELVTKRLSEVPGARRQTSTVIETLTPESLRLSLTVHVREYTLSIRVWGLLFIGLEARIDIESVPRSSHSESIVI